MSQDEIIAGLCAAAAAWCAWLGLALRLVQAPMMRATMRVTALVWPIACLALLFVVLRVFASFDVRDSTVYLTFYMVFGVGWIGAAARLTPLAGLSLVDDVIERRNWAALLAWGGALLGLTLCFAGGNIGDGPGWWVVLIAAGLATVAFYALWVAFEVSAHAWERVTVGRSAATGWRLALLLAGVGLILGRAVAGDWQDMAGTLDDFVTNAWPAAMLIAIAIPGEWAFATVERDIPASGVLVGVVPGAVYAGASVGYVVSLGWWA